MKYDGVTIHALWTIYIPYAFSVAIIIHPTMFQPGLTGLPLALKRVDVQICNGRKTMV